MPLVTLMVNHVDQSVGKINLLTLTEFGRLLLQKMWDDSNIAFKA